MRTARARQTCRAKAVRIYDHIIGDSVEQQLVEKARAIPRPAATPIAPHVEPERDPIEIARAAAALLKGVA